MLLFCSLHGCHTISNKVLDLTITLPIGLTDRATTGTCAVDDDIMGKSSGIVRIDFADANIEGSSKKLIRAQPSR